jgi:uncharacterized protein (DUF1800 family)
VTQAPVRPPVAEPTPGGPLSRRRLGRGLFAGVAAAAVTPMLPVEEAAAITRAHRRRCRHFHRCKQHPSHTCRHLHRCKHRNHQAPATTTPSNPPVQTPTEPRVEEPVEPPVQPPAQPPAEPPAEPAEPPAEPAGEPPVEEPAQPPVEPGFADAPLPTAASLHLARRFTYGMTPALHAEMRATGSPEAWFEGQLNPAAIADDRADALQSWWTSIDLDATAIWQRDQSEVEDGWRAMANYACWCLLRRTYSRRQVLEVMTEFWENHLHVPLHDDGVFTYRSDYGKVIRSHALGRFDQMLVAAITHPAMGISLDNARSTKKAPNENLGRELLELHTVGRGNHTEDDVKSSARILTGYRVDQWTTWKSYYDTASHWTGAVKVLDFAHANADADGRAVTEAYLTYLARHPRTAERIARKLAVRFVSDTPSEALVAHLARVYVDNGTAIKPVLRALVASEEFKAAAGSKVRTPTDDVVATHRALGTQIARPVDEDSAANTILWQTADIGQMPFDWARPDGQPEDNRSWSSASRLLASFDVHYGMAGRWWPKKDLTYRQPVDWLPAASVRFDALVDHLSQQLIGKPVPPQLLQACCQATGLAAATEITQAHALVKSNFAVLLTTLLDSPDHLHR